MSLRLKIGPVKPRRRISVDLPDATCPICGDCVVLASGVLAPHRPPYAGHALCKGTGWPGVTWAQWRRLDGAMVRRILVRGSK